MADRASKMADFGVHGSKKATISEPLHAMLRDARLATKMEHRGGYVALRPDPARFPPWRGSDVKMLDVENGYFGYRAGQLPGGSLGSTLNRKVHGHHFCPGSAHNKFELFQQCI